MLWNWEKAKKYTEYSKEARDDILILRQHRETAIGVFCGDVWTRSVHWEGTHYVTCDGEGCSYCAGDDRPIKRFSINIFILANKRYQIIEGGIRWLRQLIMIREKYGFGWIFEIMRIGESGDPGTTYTILPDRQLTDVQAKYIQSIPMLEMATVYGSPPLPAPTSPTSSTSPPEEDNIPF